MDPTHLYSRLEPLHAVSEVLCPSKTVPRLHSAWYQWCSTTKSSNKVIFPLGMPLCLLIKGLLLEPTRSCVLGEAIYPLPKVLQEGECSLPVYPGDPYNVLCTPRPAPYFSPECTPQLCSRVSHALSKYANTVCKKPCDIQYFSLSSL